MTVERFVSMSDRQRLEHVLSNHASVQRVVKDTALRFFSAIGWRRPRASMRTWTDSVLSCDTVSVAVALKAF